VIEATNIDGSSGDGRSKRALSPTESSKPGGSKRQTDANVPPSEGGSRWELGWARLLVRSGNGRRHDREAEEDGMSKPTQSPWRQRIHRCSGARPGRPRSIRDVCGRRRTPTRVTRSRSAAVVDARGRRGGHPCRPDGSGCLADVFEGRQRLIACLTQTASPSANPPPRTARDCSTRWQLRLRGGGRPRTPAVRAPASLGACDEHHEPACRGEHRVDRRQTRTRRKRRRAQPDA